MERKSLRRKLLILALLLQGCPGEAPEGHEYLACLVHCSAPLETSVKVYEAAAPTPAEVEIVPMPEEACRNPPPNCQTLPLYAEKD